MISAGRPIVKNKLIQLQIVYAEPQQYWLQDIELLEGSTVAQAIAMIDALLFPATLQIDPERLAVFGQKAKLSDVLAEFDRIELLRPLLRDPKDIRRQRAVLNPLKKPKK